MTRAVIFLLLAGLLAGCVTTPDNVDTPGDDSELEIVVDDARPDESFGDVITGPAVGPDLNATTMAAPRLVPGEWWRVRFEAYLADELVEVVRVVAHADEEGYIIGMPHEGWLKEAIAFHSPAFGDVSLDLSYNTHNVVFQPVRFPIVEGDTWETEFATARYIATVEAADEYEATIVFRPPEGDDPVMDTAFGLAGLVGGEMRLTYDARQHEIVRMESGLGVWEVIEHGYDFEGWVTVPRGEHTAIDYGVLGPVSEAHMPATPRTVEVDGGFNRLTMMHVAASMTGTPGYFQLRDVDPAGTEFLTEYQGSGFHVAFYESNAPDGEWIVEDTMAGAGFHYHMGIAYHQYDIRLPDGVRRTDHSHEVIR